MFVEKYVELKLNLSNIMLMLILNYNSMFVGYNKILKHLTNMKITWYLQMLFYTSTKICQDNKKLKQVDAYVNLKYIFFYVGKNIFS